MREITDPKLEIREIPDPVLQIREIEKPIEDPLFTLVSVYANLLQQKNVFT